MKKYCSLLLIVILVIVGNLLVFAEEAVEKIYPTDIKAFINGVLVDSYNIGGRTAIIVEDVTTQYTYNDELRVLLIDEFNPDFIVKKDWGSEKTKSESYDKICSTDIKTYFRGKEIKSYSLNGKMAIVVEELGGDNCFSELGGKYVWNPKERTISLESVYRYPYEIRNTLENNRVNMELSEVDGNLSATFSPSLWMSGHILCEQEILDNSFVAVLYEGETIGYRCSFPKYEITDGEDGVNQLVISENQAKVEYFYKDKIEAILAKLTMVEPMAQDWLNYYEQFTLSTVKDKFETEEYIFLYMTLANTHGGTQTLVKINKSDGTRILYDEYFKSVSLYGQKYFENVVIDREKETVSLHYDFDYVINLKNDEIKVYNNLITDIGIGTDSGQPSAYDAELARGSQSQYKLISEGEELLIEGFSIAEFYYANMLPMAETFDFLNIKYTFENNTLTLDTSEVKEFSFEKTEKKIEFLGEKPIYYLYLDKVILDGVETSITYEYLSGHFQTTHQGRAEAKPYVCNGKVYINDSFIKLLCA